jgi:hypothetical protein
VALVQQGLEQQEQGPQGPLGQEQLGPLQQEEQLVLQQQQLELEQRQHLNNNE